MTEQFLPDEAATVDAGRRFVGGLDVGDVVLLHGDLGAGKTTFVRGMLEGLGWNGPVRSPTFTLIQTYATEPPVMHADLYRLSGWEGTGIDEYLDDHLCLIEWPDRASGLIDPEKVWHVRLAVVGSGRQLSIVSPRR